MRLIGARRRAVQLHEALEFELARAEQRAIQSGEIQEIPRKLLSLNVCVCVCV